MSKKVWVNGCFDVLHHGHFKLIEYAASFGSLTIGIDSDFRVKELKGDARPFHTQEERVYNLRQLKYVNNVIIFNSEQELKTILKLFTPDVLVIGSDYINKRIIGREFVKEVKFFERISDFSTTQLLYG